MAYRISEITIRTNNTVEEMDKMKENRQGRRGIPIMLFAVSMMLTACSGSSGQDAASTLEGNIVTEQIQESEEPQTKNELSAQESITTETQTEENTENVAKPDMPILDEINQNVQTGTSGAYMTAVQEAVPYVTVDSKTGDYHG